MTLGITATTVLGIVLFLAFASFLSGHLVGTSGFKLTGPDWFDAARTTVTLLAIIGIGGASLLAYRKQRSTETTHDLATLRRSDAEVRDLRARFGAASEQLGHESPAVRLAGVYAMAALADDWLSLRRITEVQVCIDVLCAYVRIPYLPTPGTTSRLVSADSTEEFATGHSGGSLAPGHAGEREVRLTVISVIRQHLLDPSAETTWCGMNFDFTGAAIDGGNWRGIQITDGTLSFDEAQFTEGTVSFDEAQFTGGEVSFREAQFASGEVRFHKTQFAGGEVRFNKAQFTGGKVSFDKAMFTQGYVGFALAKFAGGKVTFTEAEISADGTVDFLGAQFTGSAVDFRKTRFNGGIVRFRYAEFANGTVSFLDAAFSGSLVGFLDVKLNGGAISFSMAKFSGGEVNFGAAEFNIGEIDFFAAELDGGRILFYSAKFNGGIVRFPAAAFRGGKVGFELAKFTGSEISFDQAQFDGSEVNFTIPSAWETPPQVPWSETLDPPAGVLPQEWPPLTK